jgi:hypothetical protein
VYWCWEISRTKPSLAAGDSAFAFWAGAHRVVGPLYAADALAVAGAVRRYWYGRAWMNPTEIVPAEVVVRASRFCQ